MRIVKWLSATLVLIALWGGLLIAGALEGWFRKPIAPAGDAASFMSAAVALLEDNKPASIAFMLIEEGQVFDSYYSAGIGPNTLFPVASMSKWLTAFGIMKLVDEGRIDLDAPVSTYLSRWQLPPSDFDNQQVTTRLLLSHMAGFTDGLGFGDYTAEEQLPSIVESLENPRASSGAPVAIKVGREPGSEWAYSGGGYLLLELLVEEVSGVGFAEYMNEAVFTPLGMNRSTYEYLGGVADVAPSLSTTGEVAPYYRYAASGATGLATSAHDLTLLVTALLAPSPDPALLSSSSLLEMRAPHAYLLGFPVWGLGTILYAPTAGGDFIYGHAGQNEPALNAEVRLNPDNNDGIIILVTGNPSLATRLGFLWTFWQTGLPDFIGTETEVMRVLPAFAGGVLLILLLGGWGCWRTRPHSVRSAQT